MAGGSGSLAEAVVNTRSIAFDGLESIKSPDDLQGLFRHCGIRSSGRPTRKALEDFLKVRREIRTVFEAKGTPAALALINNLLDGAKLSLGVSGTRSDSIELVWNVYAIDDPVKALKHRVGVDLAVLVSRIGGERLRVCESQPCTDVFVDRSKKGQQRFCNATCATRYHVANFRRRKHDR
jgi:predicted RNA-binding Zn ribbon-like protein